MPELNAGLYLVTEDVYCLMAKWAKSRRLNPPLASYCTELTGELCSKLECILR
jgi:hypothetical protein